MTLIDIVNRSKPYTQEEFMEALIETFSDRTNELPWEIVVVTPERDFKFKNYEKAIGFLFDRISCFNWHVGNFALSQSWNYLYISLFREVGK